MTDVEREGQVVDFEKWKADAFNKWGATTFEGWKQNRGKNGRKPPDPSNGQKRPLDELTDAIRAFVNEFDLGSFSNEVVETIRDIVVNNGKADNKPASSPTPQASHESHGSPFSFGNLEALEERTKLQKAISHFETLAKPVIEGAVDKIQIGQIHWLQKDHTYTFHTREGTISLDHEEMRDAIGTFNNIGLGYGNDTYPRPFQPVSLRAVGDKDFRLLQKEYKIDTKYSGGTLIIQDTDRLSGGRKERCKTTYSVERSGARGQPNNVIVRDWPNKVA